MNTSGKFLFLSSAGGGGYPFGSGTTFTPTGSYTSNTTYEGIYWREGAFALINYKITFTGTPNAAANATVQLPTGLTGAATLLQSSVTTRTGILGTGFYSTNSANPLTVAFIGSSGLLVGLNAQALAQSAASFITRFSPGSSFPVGATAGFDMTFWARVPIHGWE